MNAVVAHDLVRVSVYEAICASVDDHPYHISMRALAVLERVEDRMPALFNYVSANGEVHMKPFMDFVSSLPRLPSLDGLAATSKDIDLWLEEVTSEAHVKMPAETYRTCIHTLLRRVLCVTREDVIDFDVGFYKAMMAFVRPMRDAVTVYNLTH